ncbi:MAG: glycosyltransferase family 39 protein [Planctomycetaceae bacterium]|nr:glycosyltransferase family 39 protein [Planctomycetaceae bacterium]
MTSPSPSVRQIDPWFWRLFLIAVGVRIVYLFFFLNSPYAVLQLTDQAYYRNWGIAIAGGDFLGEAAFEQGPFYAYFLGLLYTVGFSDTMVIALQMLLGATIAPLIYSCAQKLNIKPAAAIIAGLLTACYGPLIYHEAMIMKSWLSPLCTTCALWGTLNFIETKKSSWLWLTGVVIGIVSLVRENHLLLILPVLLFLFVQRTKCAPLPFWKAAVIPVLGMGLMIFPATLRNYLVANEFVLVTSGGGEVLYMAHGPYAKANYNPPPFIRPNPYFEHEDFRKEAARQTGKQMTRSESSRYWSDQAKQTILSDPARTLSLTFWKGYNLVNNFEVPDNQIFLVTRSFIPLLYVLPRFAWIFGFALGGLWQVRREWRIHLLPVGLIFVHVITILIFYNFGRFRIGLTPLLMLYASWGMVNLYEEWKGLNPVSAEVNLPRNRIRFVTGLIVTAVGTLISFLPAHDVNASFYRGLDQQAAYLKESAQLGARREQARQNVTAQPETPEAWLQLAQLEYTLSQFEEANQATDAGLKMAPFRTDLLDVKADALIGLRRTEAAAALLEKTIEEHPEHLPAYVKLATLKADDYDTVGAIEILDEALKHDKENVTLWFNRGNIAALHCFNKSLYGESESAQMCETAASSLERARELSPQDGRVLHKLSDYYLRQHELEKSLDALAAGVATHPEPKAYQGLIPEILRQAGSELSERQRRQFLQIVDQFVQQLADSPNPELATELIERLVSITRELKLSTFEQELLQSQPAMQN